MQKKEKIVENLNVFFTQRVKIYEFFDINIPKLANTELYDFSKLENKELEAMYKLFHHYDYAVRKLLPSLYGAYEIDVDKDLKKDF